MINICLTFNLEYKKLYEMSAKSFKHKFVRVIPNLVNTKGDTGFGTDSWYEAILSQHKWTLNNMNLLPKDQIICCCDIDVLCFNKNNLIKNCIEFINSEYDIAAACENFHTFNDNAIAIKNINTGFMLLKNNINIKNMLNKLCETNLKEYRFADQDFINHYKSDNTKLKCKYLDPYEHVLQCHIRHMDRSKLKNCTTYHANCTRNLKQKLLKIRRFKRIVSGRG